MKCNGIGSGWYEFKRDNCTSCSGSGNINKLHLIVIKSNEWTQPCKNCGGSGIIKYHRKIVCKQCIGYKYIMVS